MQLKNLLMLTFGLLMTVTVSSKVTYQSPDPASNKLIQEIKAQLKSKNLAHKTVKEIHSLAIESVFQKKFYSVPRIFNGPESEIIVSATKHNGQWIFLPYLSYYQDISSLIVPWIRKDFKLTTYGEAHILREALEDAFSISSHKNTTEPRESNFTVARKGNTWKINAERSDSFGTSLLPLFSVKTNHTGSITNIEFSNMQLSSFYTLDRKLSYAHQLDAAKKREKYGIKSGEYKIDTLEPNIAHEIKQFVIKSDKFKLPEQPEQIQSLAVKRVFNNTLYSAKLHYHMNSDNAYATSNPILTKQNNQWALVNPNKLTGLVKLNSKLPQFIRDDFKLDNERQAFIFLEALRDASIIPMETLNSKLEFESITKGPDYWEFNFSYDFVSKTDLKYSVTTDENGTIKTLSTSQSSID